MIGVLVRQLISPALPPLGADRTSERFGISLADALRPHPPAPLSQNGSGGYSSGALVPSPGTLWV